MNYPLIVVDILLRGINSGSCKVTAARINPVDLTKVNLQGVNAMLRCNVQTSSEVMPGYLYVDSISK